MFKILGQIVGHSQHHIRQGQIVGYVVLTVAYDLAQNLEHLPVAMETEMPQRTDGESSEMGSGMFDQVMMTDICFCPEIPHVRCLQ